MRLATRSRGHRQVLALADLVAAGERPDQQPQRVVPFALPPARRGQSVQAGRLPEDVAEGSGSGRGFPGRRPGPVDVTLDQADLAGGLQSHHHAPGVADATLQFETPAGVLVGGGDVTPPQGDLREIPNAIAVPWERSSS